MRQDRLTICLLTSSFPSNASDLVAAPFLPPFLEALQRQGVDVVVYTQDRLGVKTPVLDVPICWFPWGATEQALSQLKPYIPAHCARMVRLVRAGRRHLLPWLRDQHVDLCLAAWAVPSGYFAWYAKRVLGTPYCVWALGSDMYSWARYPIMRQVIRQTLRHADGLFADGFDLSNRVQSLAGQPCAFLPSVRPLPATLPAVSVDVDPQQTNFLFIGRWERVKGLDVLIEAMRLLAPLEPSARLYVLGKGSMQGWLEHRLRAYGLTERVFVREDVPTPVLQGYLQQCDCLVIPSRSDSIPLVFSEGLQAHKPMIVSEIGDLATLVRRFCLGHVVPPGEPYALKEALQQFIVQRRSAPPAVLETQEAQALFNIHEAAAQVVRHARAILAHPTASP